MWDTSPPRHPYSLEWCKALPESPLIGVVTAPIPLPQLHRHHPAEGATPPDAGGERCQLLGVVQWPADSCTDIGIRADG